MAKMTTDMMERQSSLDLPARRFTYPTQAVFLSQAALLEEVGPPKIPTIACFLGFALVCIAIATSAFVKIDVVSSSTGHLISSTTNQGLQSFDGGIVKKIHVKEGQAVDANDLLITLRDPEAEAQLNRLRARQASLATQAKRLRQLTGINSHQQNIEQPGTAQFKRQQMAILPLEEAAVAAEKAVVQAEISRRIKTLTNLRDLRENTSTTLRLVNQKFATQKQLHEKNLVSTSDLLEAERDAANAKLDLAKIDGQTIETEALILESKRRLEDVVASRRQRQGERLSSIMVDLGELQEQILSTQNRLKRSTFKAPIRSVIHELNAEFAGQIIAPGDLLVELIPIEDDLIVDARLPTTEIRYVKKGQEVRISVDGVEPHRVGYLEGSVQRLSPSTFIDENGMPYYQALIALRSNELAGLRLIPGMTVQAQIKTDQRTILEYLLKPIYRAWNTAFRER